MSYRAIVALALVVSGVLVAVGTIVIGVNQ
jgi:hypothetical protein